MMVSLLMELKRPDDCKDPLLGGRAATMKVALLLMLSLAADAAVCTGKSVNLAPKQCAAYMALWDSSWTGDCTGDCTGCTRADPCGSCSDCIACNAAGTGITQMNLHASNLVGPLPASLADLVNVARFDVQGNNITGGTLPAMNFGQMAFCYLLDNPASSAREHLNTFLCPWPQGAVAKCTKEDSSGNWVPITEADCHNTTTLELYECVNNNTCVLGDTGVLQAACEVACGHAQPLLIL